MRLPKSWNKMKLNEQENYLIKKLSEIYEIENFIKKSLATIRGGQRIHASEDISRPDEALLKSNN